MSLLLSLEEETVLAITLLTGQGEGPDVTGVGMGMPHCILRHTAELMPGGDGCFSAATKTAARALPSLDQTHREACGVRSQTSVSLP